MNIEQVKDDSWNLEKWKVLNDPVHGHFRLHPLLWRIIDTVQFQRLRFIKQLGVTCYVYPGATHTRFEHSLGVCYLAGELLTQLRKNSPSRLTEEDILCVQIAGLCHDLGHGPFSHAWEHFLNAAEPILGWKHEIQSIKMLKYLIKENNLMDEFYFYGLSDLDLEFICELIAPKDDVTLESWSYIGRPVEKAFLYEVIANKRNGIDVDKWDYFLRDGHHLGLTISFDYKHLLSYIKVLDVDGELSQLAYRDKECHSIYEIFHSRLTLHSRAYQHPVVTIIQSMLIDALLEANKVMKFHFAEKVFSLASCVSCEDVFVTLTDSIMPNILFSNDASLKPAKDIFQSILVRRFYWAVGSINISRPLLRDDQKHLIEGFIKQLPPQIHLNYDDLAISTIDYNFGLGVKNPLDHVKFYQKSFISQSISANNCISNCYFLPNKFRELILLLICKKSLSLDVKNMVTPIFKEWSKKLVISEDGRPQQSQE